LKFYLKNEGYTENLFYKDNQESTYPFLLRMLTLSGAMARRSTGAYRVKLIEKKLENHDKTEKWRTQELAAIIFSIMVLSCIFGYAFFSVYSPRSPVVIRITVFQVLKESGTRLYVETRDSGVFIMDGGEGFQLESEHTYDIVARYQPSNETWYVESWQEVSK
jgi:hypothetical protein